MIQDPCDVYLAKQLQMLLIVASGKYVQQKVVYVVQDLPTLKVNVCTVNLEEVEFSMDRHNPGCVYLILMSVVSPAERVPNLQFTVCLGFVQSLYALSV